MNLTRAWIATSVTVQHSVVKLILRCQNASFAVRVVGVSLMLLSRAMQNVTVRTVMTRQAWSATRNLVDFASAPQAVSLRQKMPNVLHQHHLDLLSATMAVLSAKTMWMMITAIVLTAATKTNTLVMTAPVHPLIRHVLVPGKQGLFFPILFQCVVLNSRRLSILSTFEAPSAHSISYPN